jgi:hypothetical protein
VSSTQELISWKLNTFKNILIEFHLESSSWQIGDAKESCLLLDAVP